MGDEPTPSAPGAQACLRQRPDVLHRRVGDDVLVLPLDGTDPLLLDGIGALIWTLLDQAHTVDELVALLAPAADAAAGTIRVDVASFLEQLVDADLVEVAP